VHDVTGLAAFDQAQRPMVEEAMQPVARGSNAETYAMGKPRDRKADTHLAFQAAVPQQKGVDRMVNHRQLELWNDIVVELFPHTSSIEFVVVHVFYPELE